MVLKGFPHRSLATSNRRDGRRDPWQPKLLRDMGGRWNTEIIEGEDPPDPVPPRDVDASSDICDISRLKHVCLH